MSLPKIQAPPLARNIEQTKEVAKEAAEAKKAEDAKKVGRDFEAILVRQMLANVHIGGTGGYADMASEAFTSAVTAGGGLGFGRVIADQLTAAALSQTSAGGGAARRKAGG